MCELLCPAGSPKALEAAIEGGADAVYFGGVGFNARRNAPNFTEEEMRASIALAHTHGVRPLRRIHPAKPRLVRIAT